MVGMATRYGLDGPGVESRKGRDFPQQSKPALGTSQGPIQWVSGQPWGYSDRDAVLTTQPHRGTRLKKK
jgi:hypothetical protein